MKRIIICGPSCSGKTSLKNALVSHGMKPGISYTTRSIREGEVDGSDYRFVTAERFNELLKQGIFVEHDDSFGDLYGTSREDFESCDVFILTPKAISQMRDKSLLGDCHVVYLVAPIHTRVSRASERGDSVGKILKRISRDCATFSGFSDYDVEIDTADMKIEELLKEVES